MAMDEENQLQDQILVDNRKCERAMLMGCSVLSSLILLAVGVHGHVPTGKLVSLAVIAVLGVLLFFLVMTQDGPNRDRDEYFYGLFLGCSLLLSMVTVAFMILYNFIHVATSEYPWLYYFLLAQFFIMFAIHSVVGFTLFRVAGEDQSDVDRDTYKREKGLYTLWDAIKKCFYYYCQLCNVITVGIVTDYSNTLDIGRSAALSVALAVIAHSYHVPSIGLNILHDTKAKKRMHRHSYVLFLPHLCNTLLLVARIHSTLYGWLVCAGLIGVLTVLVVASYGVSRRSIFKDEEVHRVEENAEE